MTGANRGTGTAYVCHSHADIPGNPSALLQQNIRITITFLKNKYQLCISK
jgi:hypothetical protein